MVFAYIAKSATYGSIQALHAHIQEWELELRTSRPVLHLLGLWNISDAVVVVAIELKSVSCGDYCCKRGMTTSHFQQ